ncbi:MAG: metal-dependent phosphohydrolase [Fibrella sp.]|nr:metal-dependent phosphohydrolase [Armatimonadota bacterium]
MDTISLETAFACIAPHSRPIMERLRKQLQTPFRAYHNEAHTRSVVERAFDFSGGTPSVPLVAAALYHDAIYDPNERDNEARSADFCRGELSGLGFAPKILDEAARLILLTTDHRPNAEDADGIILCDADLYILGSSPDEYATYRSAIRTEYAHVSTSAWNTGREQVLARFLERPQIFHGYWVDVVAYEARARRNIAGEISSLREAGETRH